ncbi:hypothetical protein VTJ83DRAFT_3613 [Remersonia thermophila]|uniref:Uncharacterized protein n=1 Tax=Remersonia thermophila TaxID=72144 RepID=A0ABR4DES9_9PEZI
MNQETSTGTPEEPLRLGDANFDSRPDVYPGIILAGDAYSRGFQYGQLMADEIQTNVARHLSDPSLPDGEHGRRLMRRFISCLRESWSAGWDEMRGVADGSGIDIEHVVLLNVADDLRAWVASERGRTPPAPESASAFFSPRVTAAGAPLVAHSWAAPKAVVDEGLLAVLEVHLEEWPWVLSMVTEAGRISGPGVNAEGLAVVGDRIASTLDGGNGGGDDDDHDHDHDDAKSVFPLSCLERLVLEHGDFATTRAVCEMHDWRASRHLLVVEPTGRSMSLEIYPGVGKPAVYQGPATGAYVAHANHFQSLAAFAERRNPERSLRHLLPVRPSAARLGRLLALVRDGLGRGERLTRDRLQDIFADHKEKEEGAGAAPLCRHVGDEDDNMTAVFVVLDGRNKVVSVCRGPPCKGTLMHYKMADDPGSPCFLEDPNPSSRAALAPPDAYDVQEAEAHPKLVLWSPPRENAGYDNAAPQPDLSLLYPGYRPRTLYGGQKKKPGTITTHYGPPQVMESIEMTDERSALDRGPQQEEAAMDLRAAESVHLAEASSRGTKRQAEDPAGESAMREGNKRTRAY